MRPLNARDNRANRRGEFAYARSGNNDGVAAAMSFLGNAKKFAALVLPKLDVEMLPFDLNLFRFQDVVHFPSCWKRSVSISARQGKKILNKSA